jgi:hypothetical protein
MSRREPSRMVQKLDRVFQLIDSALRFGALVAHPQDGLRVFLAAVAGLQVIDVQPGTFRQGHRSRPLSLPLCLLRPDTARQLGRIERPPA